MNRGSVLGGRVLGALGTLLVLGCAQPVEPGSDLNVTHTTAHYLFRMAEGDSVDIDWQESYYTWIQAELELVSDQRLEYFKYRDRAHLGALTGRDTNGFAEPGTVRFHTIWPRDNHEGVHTLVILYLGHPPALFNEGVAVAHHMDPAAGDLVPRWNQDNVHELARGFARADRLPELDRLIASPGFFSFSVGITYPSAGSFVRYLLDTHGLAAFRRLLSGATFDDAGAVTRQRFEAAYGVSLDQAWDAWLEWLESAECGVCTGRADTS